MPVTSTCSFCLKAGTAVDHLISGPGTFICNECVDRCVDILASAAPSSPASEPDLPPWHGLDDDDVLARLPRMAAVASHVEAGLRRWVGEARNRGATWEQVGESLNMTRQSAWERFAQSDNS